MLKGNNERKRAFFSRRNKNCSQETFSLDSVMLLSIIGLFRNKLKKCLNLASCILWIDVISTPVKIGIPCGSEELSAGQQINDN